MNKLESVSIELTTFSVMCEDVLTDLNRKVLAQLYMPIIGDKAFNLYSTLYTFIEIGSFESKVENHLRLINTLSISNDDLIISRKILEAMGLLETYFKEDHFIYVLHKVLSPAKFLTNNELMFLLIEKIGNDSAEKLAYDFLVRSLDISKYTNISSSFDEIFEMVNEADGDKFVPYTVNTENNGIQVNNKDFNLNLFAIMIDGFDLLDKETISSTKFLDTSLRLAFLYQLTEEELVEAIKFSVSVNKSLDYDKYIANVKQIYTKKGIKLKPARKKLVVKASDAQVNALEKTSPNLLVKAKYGTNLTASEIEMFDALLVQTGVTVGFLNVVIIYVMEQKNGEIPAYNFFLKVINTWIRAGVKTTSDCLRYINKETPSTPKKQYAKQPVKTMPSPDWVNDYQKSNEKQEKTTLSFDEIEQLFVSNGNKGGM